MHTNMRETSGRIKAESSIFWIEILLSDLPEKSIIIMYKEFFHKSKKKQRAYNSIFTSIFH